jgi:hypothetical protein
MSRNVSFDASLERYVRMLEAHNPNLLELLKADTETAFVKATEGALDRVIRTIEEGGVKYSALDERGLSTLLTDLLIMSGFQATAERNVNGHVDVVIEHSFGGRWKYLGECKMYKGFKYHVEGCKQLLGYCVGRELRAFCLDFFGVSGMIDKLEKLRTRMDAERPLFQAARGTNHWIAGAFVTGHRHAIGRDIEVLHLGCSVPER